MVTMKMVTMVREYEARIKVATMMPLILAHLIFVVEAGKDFFWNGDHIVKMRHKSLILLICLEHQSLGS